LETNEENKNKVVDGKPWKNEAYFDTYSEADMKRHNMLSAWLGKEEFKGRQVKVKRLSDRYVVKTRLHPDFEPKITKKKEKKSGKNSRRNREAAKARKYDASADI
jgi:hypothetical protein